MGRPPRQSLTSMLIEAVTERIQSGQYKRGDQLPTEKDLIEEFGVSRTVVREAIANLKASGLVSTHQGKGAFVLERGGARRSASPRTSSLSPRICSRRWRCASPSNPRPPPWPPGAGRPEQLAAIEAACDAMDAALGAGRGDGRARHRLPPCDRRGDRQPAFRRAVQLSRGSADDAGAALGVGRAAVDGPPTTPRRCGEFQARISSDHRRIVEAIAAGDSDGARAALRMHLGGSRDRLAARIRA